jgi:predicted aspartyl protease
MMSKTSLFVSVSIASLALFAAEKRVQMKDLPEPVQKTVREQTKTAKLRGLAEEVENGKTLYEAETTLNGKSRDMLIDATGAIVEVEEATELGSIPAAAQKTLKTAAGAGKILSVETVTKGSEVSYEAVVQKAGKKSEVAVNADGSLKK